MGRKMKTFNEIRTINVKEWIEKKGKFNYLSWASAVDQLLQLDTTATWEYKEPSIFTDGTMMVYCAVTAFGKTMQAQLPVLNNVNKAIPNPNAMDVNTAMQRCLAKAIALHGLGLYIYNGEDLPDVDEPAKPAVTYITADQVKTVQTTADLAGVSAEQICKTCGIASLNMMPTQMFDGVVKKLNLTIENKGKQDEKTDTPTA